MRIWQRKRQEYAERLKAIRARVRRSLEDPRADLSEAEAEAALETTFAEIDNDLDRAAP
jgi:antitoxin ParD1/3/4